MKSKWSIATYLEVERNLLLIKRRRAARSVPVANKRLDSTEDLLAASPR